jgi:hypothetical protein
MCPLLFGFFLKCVDLHVPTYFCEYLYAKGMLKKKHVNAIFLLLYIYIYIYLFIYYAAMVRSTWGLKECKSIKQFYDFFNVGIGNKTC